MNRLSQRIAARIALAAAKLADLKSNPAVLLQLLDQAGIPAIQTRYLGGYDLLADVRGRSITESILIRGHYQNELASLFAKLNPIPDIQIVNIGANIGTTCINLHSAGFRDFLLLEPVAKNHELLRRNLAMNEIQAQLHKAAAGAEQGAVEISLHPNSGGRHSLRASFGWKTERVDVVTVDSLGISRDCALWIDTEGFEYQVLLGAADTLSKHARVVCLEVTPALLGEDLKPLARLLERHFNRFVTLDNERGATSLMQLVEERQGAQFDVICQR